MKHELLALEPRTHFEKWQDCYYDWLATIVLDQIDCELDDEGNLPKELPADLSQYDVVWVYEEDLPHYRARLEKEFDGLDGRLKENGKTRLFTRSLARNHTIRDLCTPFWNLEIHSETTTFKAHQLARSDEQVFEQLFARFEAFTLDTPFGSYYENFPRVRCAVLQGKDPGCWHEATGTLQRCLMDLAQLTGRRHFWELGAGSVRRYLEQRPPDAKDTDSWSLIESIQQLYEVTGEAPLLERIRATMRLREKKWCMWDGMWTYSPDHKYVRDSTLGTMVMPGVRAAKYMEDARAIYDQAVHQSKRTEELLRDPATGLYYFGGDGKRHTPTLIGHGSYWHMFANVGILMYMPKDHPGYEEVANVFRRLARAVAKVQGPEGLWHHHADRIDTSMPDVVYTGNMLGCIYRGLTVGVLDRDEFEPVARRAMDGYKLFSFRGCLAGGSPAMPISGSRRFYLENNCMSELFYGNWQQMWPIVGYLMYEKAGGRVR